MHHSLTDEETIRQFLNSSPTQCFETLYNRYVNKVYRRCLSMTKDAEKAEDFTHDIFIKAFAKLDAFQERSSFSTWLYSIAFNYCSDQLRKAKRFDTLSIDGSMNSDFPDSINEAHVHEETLQLVNLAITTLTANEQSLLKLKYEEGRSVNEIAAMYNLNPSAVKMRLKRSREKIYRLYKKHEVI